MYKTQSPDTSEAVERIQFDLLRNASKRRRLELARAHTFSATRLSRRRIARQNPTWNDQEIGLHLISLMYGAEIEEKVRRELSRRKPATKG